MKSLHEDYEVSFLQLSYRPQRAPVNAFAFVAHLLEMLKVEQQLGIILSPGRGKIVSALPFLHYLCYSNTFIMCHLFIYLFIYVFIFNKFIYLYLVLAVLGLRCCTWAFSSCSERGLLFVVAHGFLIAVASLVAEHGLQARWLQQLRHVGSVVVTRRLQSTGSVVVAHGLSCSAACGTFLDQGSNLCPLHWQVDS